MTERLIKKLFEEATFFGGLGFYAFLIILFLILKDTESSLRLLLGLILIYFATFITRMFYFKQRPDKTEYDNFLEKIDASSFPSVHAARITLLFLFSINMILNPLWKILFGIVFLIVLYSRVYIRRHYFSDLAGGIAIGAIVFLITSL